MNDWEDDRLLEEYVRLAETARILGEEMGHIMMELTHRLEARGAQGMYHPTIQCRLDPPRPEYDTNKLMGLKELLPPAIIAKGFTPEHMEKVPDKFDMRTVKSWGTMFGHEVKGVIDGARLPAGPGRIRVTQKKEAKE
jgi:hypothetical protein